MGALQQEWSYSEETAAVILTATHGLLAFLLLPFPLMVFGSRLYLMQCGGAGCHGSAPPEVLHVLLLFSKCLMINGVIGRSSLVIIAGFNGAISSLVIIAAVITRLVIIATVITSLVLIAFATSFIITAGVVGVIFNIAGLVIRGSVGALIISIAVTIIRIQAISSRAVTIIRIHAIIVLLVSMGVEEVVKAPFRLHAYYHKEEKKGLWPLDSDPKHRIIHKGERGSEYIDVGY